MVYAFVLKQKKAPVLPEASTGSVIASRVAVIALRPQSANCCLGGLEPIADVSSPPEAEIGLALGKVRFRAVFEGTVYRKCSAATER